MAKRQPLEVVTSPARQTSGDPLRAALVAAIKAAEKTKAKLAAHRAAIQRAEQQVTP